MTRSFDIALEALTNAGESLIDLTRNCASLSDTHALAMADAMQQLIMVMNTVRRIGQQYDGEHQTTPAA